jgi:hypothetical protein
MNGILYGGILYGQSKPIRPTNVPMLTSKRAGERKMLEERKRKGKEKKRKEKKKKYK